MKTIEDAAGLADRPADTVQRQADWDGLVASLTDLCSEVLRACALCGGVALYEGQGCADSGVVRLCRSCLDAAISRLCRMRDDAKQVTGCEPRCNRCWRPVLDPATHIDLRALCP
jgi:hypothetical protein